MIISIIIPLYKGKKYISSILEMLEQNLDILNGHNANVKLEVIFVNDFPSEKVDNVALEVNQHIFISFFHNERNLGIHRSRLNGLKKATGIYILFLDQDDKISPFYLWRQLKCIGEADAVLCNGWYRDNKKIYKDLEQQKQTLYKSNYIRRGNTIVSPGQVIIRRTAIPQRWCEVVLKKNGSDDVLLWTLMLCDGKTFAINPFEDYFHVEAGTNTSLDFANMKESVEEMLNVVKTRKLINDDDLKLFENGCKNRINKYVNYLTILENWESILQNIIKLMACYSENTLAIYGNGIIGKKLAADLTDAGVKIMCMIDENADNFTESKYDIYRPDNIMKNIDIIISTVVFDEKNVAEKLRKFSGIIFSINRFIPII